MPAANGLRDCVVDSMNDALSGVLDPRLLAVLLNAVVGQIATSGRSDSL